MNLKKSFIALLLTTAIFVTGCSENTTSGTSDTSGAGDNTSSGVTEVNEEIRDISSMELVKEMKIGWNLGNTLDAGYKGISNTSPETIETSWGNPVTTKEMIDDIKAAGFNVLRVPITWEWSTGEGPDYIISEAWMNRVKEVVNYGIDNDMFVILNIHHETWHYPTEENYEAASDRLKKVWTQIANNFKGYDEHLIFEGMNEPRVVGTSEEWMGGSEPTRAVINKLNKDFIETVRSTGGNNEKRHLMIPPYGANSGTVALQALEVPEDDDKIIVSVHGYLPYNFALADGSADLWFASRENYTKDIDTLVNDLKTIFIDKGIPVIMGEFGARSRNNEIYRAHWAKYYVTAMKEIGVPCVWWDNNAYVGAGECFGLYNRAYRTWTFSKVKDALISAANGEYTIDEIKKEGEQLMEEYRQSKKEEESAPEATE